MKTALIFATGMLLISACSSEPKKPAKPEQPTVAVIEEVQEQAAKTEEKTPVPAPKVVQIMPPDPDPGPPDPGPYPPDPGPIPEPLPDPIPVAPEPRIYDYAEEMPEFPGGMEAYKKFLVDNIRYPESAKEMGIEGRCYLRFVVTEQGDIKDVEVVKGIPGGRECDLEARRVLRMMPNWKPGRNGGKAVSCFVTMPVAFKMN